MDLTTAAAVIDYVGVKTPSPAELAWAEQCAAAVNEAIEVRLNGASVLNPPPKELVLVATMAGGEAYKRREAPFGVASFDGQGEAVRLARDYLDGVRPQIDRWGAGPGIA